MRLETTDAGTHCRLARSLLCSFFTGVAEIARGSRLQCVDSCLPRVPQPLSPRVVLAVQALRSLKPVDPSEPEPVDDKQKNLPTSKKEPPYQTMVRMRAGDPGVPSCAKMPEAELSPRCAQLASRER